MAKIKGWKFPIDVDSSTGKIMEVEDNDSVKQGIEIILRTERSERKMRPSFGMNFNDFMFENIDMALVKNMSNSIADAVKDWEEHVKRLVVNVSKSEENPTSVITDITYITDIEPEQQDKIVKNFNINDLSK